MLLPRYGRHVGGDATFSINRSRKHRCVQVQALGQASSSGLPDARALFMEPEKQGSDLSKRLNAVLRCKKLHMRSLSSHAVGVKLWIAAFSAHLTPRRPCIA